MAIVEVRLSGVRLEVSRPDHPLADKDGCLRVEVAWGWRGASVGRAPFPRATLLDGTSFWLSREEREAAIHALTERDRRLAQGDVTL